MRRWWSLLVVLGLITTQGCKTVRHTAGVCDCNPPPVESLLKGPCPSVGTPVTPINSDGAPYHSPRGVNGPATLHPTPTVNNGKVISSPPVVPTSPTTTEPVQVLPRILEKK